MRYYLARSSKAFFTVASSALLTSYKPSLRHICRAVKIFICLDRSVLSLGPTIFILIESFTAKSLKIKKNPHYKPIEKLIDYEIFCGVKTASTIPEISIIDFKKMQSEGIDFQFIDVREPYEYAVANLGAILYPLSILSEKLIFLSKKTPIVIHCQSGGRSVKAVAELQKLGFDNAVSLKGGIKAYLEKD